MVGAMASTGAHAQSEPEIAEPAATSEQDSGSSLMDDIVVTAQKKNRAERAQSVPMAISAITVKQLDALHLVTVADVGATAPSVSLSGLGTLRGVVAASIRGIGTNSSIPSIEPAVGFFVDGVYLGTNFGVVLDTFDIEGVEIQRGPQGTLQGRNVTGGAVMIRTQRPGNAFAVRAQTSIETGPEYAFAASVEGPLGNTIRAKLAGYYRKDEGWFTNQTTGKPFGRESTWFFRPTVVIEPTDG